MPTLTYATPDRYQRPFPCHFLIAGFICLAILLAFHIANYLFDDRYFGPPNWLPPLARYLFLPALLSILAGLITGFMLPLHSFSSPMRPLILLFASASLLAPLFTPSLNRPLYSHYPYQYLLSNARALAQSANIYAADHAGHYPPHPAILLINEYLSPKQLADFDATPYSLSSPPPPDSDWPLIAPALDAHSLFIYTAADLTSSPLDSKIILAYTKPTKFLPQHHILAFADGHAELLPDPALPAYFSTSNTARASLHLPPSPSPRP